GWTSALILGSFALSLTMVVAFVILESRTADPMVDLSLFRSRVFSGGNAALILGGVGGAAFLPMALTMAAIAPVADPVARRFGTHRTVAAGITAIVIGLLMISMVGEHGHFVDLMPGFVLFGIGSGFTIMPLNAAVIGVFPPDRAGAASGIINTSRELSGLLGVTIMGAILTTRETSVLHAGVDPLLAFLEVYRFALVIPACIGAVGI